MHMETVWYFTESPTESHKQYLKNPIPIIQQRYFSKKMPLFQATLNGFCDQAESTLAPVDFRGIRSILPVILMGWLVHISPYREQKHNRLITVSFYLSSWLKTNRYFS